MSKKITHGPALFLLVVLALTACARGKEATPSPEAGLVGEAQTLTVYSGRSESLVGPLFEQFRQATGITVQVKYGDTAELAALIAEEGDASPADLFFAQDAGALGAVSKEGRFVRLPEDLLGKVPATYRSDDAEWVGLSGRARVVVYNTKIVNKEDLPQSITGFSDPKWKGKLGWAPTNGSFQAFITAFRKLKGEEAARKWLQDLKANETRAYPKNDAIVLATASGEIEAGFVNHYYLLTLRSQKGTLDAENFFVEAGDAGSLVNVAGAGILATSKAQKTAARLIEFMLSGRGQKYFLEKSFEYPLVAGVGTPAGVPSLAELKPPKIDLSDLDDLKGTLDLFRQVGLL